MRFLTLLVLFTTIHFALPAQSITYNIPEGYEKTISQGDYKKLVDFAVAAVSKRYKIEVVKDGAIQLAKGQDMEIFNLHNLITKCVALKDTNQWERQVQGHFENIFSSIDEEKNIDPENFESMKKYLSLRIYPKEVVNQRGGTSSLVVKTDLEGTYTLLMMDLPGAFAPIDKAVFDRWKKTPAEVFKIAQDNINKQEIEKVTQEFDVDGVKISISFLGNEDYAASYALDLMNNSPNLVGEWGSVIAMPNKGLVDICKVSKTNPVDFVKFIQRTKPLVEESFQQHEQPISNQYFWYYRGVFTKITVLTAANGNINVISPMGLTELMTKK